MYLSVFENINLHCINALNDDYYSYYIIIIQVILQHPSLHIIAMD